MIEQKKILADADKKLLPESNEGGAK
jgi:hypothetical protein